MGGPSWTSWSGEQHGAPARGAVSLEAMTEREDLVRRGLALNWATLAYNSMEAVVALVSGLIAGSVALVGFGIDSVIEVTASGAAQWRLRSDWSPGRRASVERVSSRIVGVSFFALGAYVVVESLRALVGREAPERSWVGLGLLAASVVVMPILARAKSRVAERLGSRALRAEAAQTDLCAWLSAIALVGVALNAALGWWWADPAAALAMTPIILREGLSAVRGDPCCDECAH
jgi:divalent metal cation (Fe/Co/Zn/Cd) transporter